MKKFLNRTAMLSMTLFLILASIFLVVNTRTFYTDQYKKNNTEQATGMSVRDLDKATALLLDYLNDKRDDLDMTADKFGVSEQVFDRREKTHMVDVKALYAGAGTAMVFFAAFAAATIFVLARKTPKKDLPVLLKHGYKTAAVFTVVLALALAAAFTLGFDRFWTAFHHVFFTNDLWLLDPRTSTMINMFPLEFFLAMCTRILVVFLSLFALAGIFIELTEKKIRTKR